jgi:hypothetical protein
MKFILLVFIAVTGTITVKGNETKELKELTDIEQDFDMCIKKAKETKSKEQRKIKIDDCRRARWISEIRYTRNSSPDICQHT